MLFFCLLSWSMALFMEQHRLDMSKHPYAGDYELTRQLLSNSNALSGNKPLSSWAKMAYALPHEMLRRELAVVQRAARKMDLNVPWHLPAFFSYWRFLVPVIHGHHWAEEHVLFPAILNKTGGSLPPQVNICLEMERNTLTFACR